MGLKLTAVVLQDALGFPRAWPVVVERSKGERRAWICLPYDDRRDLDRAAQAGGSCKDGVGWCAQVRLVRNRAHEGGPEISMEPARGGWTNAESMAVETDSIVGRLPKEPYRGEKGNMRPAEGLCWREATLVAAVHAAHALAAGKK